MYIYTYIALVPYVKEGAVGCNWLCMYLRYKARNAISGHGGGFVISLNPFNKDTHGYR